MYILQIYSSIGTRPQREQFSDKQRYLLTNAINSLPSGTVFTIQKPVQNQYGDCLIATGHSIEELYKDIKMKRRELKNYYKES